MTWNLELDDLEPGGLELGCLDLVAWDIVYSDLELENSGSGTWKLELGTW